MKRVVIDSNCIGSTSLFALKDLRMNEVPTAVIYGFLRQLQTIYTELKSRNFIMCWDSKESLRKELFPEYKLRRKEDRTARERDIWATAYDQFNQLRIKYLPRMGFTNQLLAKGFEADDLLVKVAHSHWGGATVIVTTDGDLLQCLGYADIWNPRKKVLITKETFIKEWGIHPGKWGEVKAIAGCRTDCVPGIQGVGEKTAVKFLLRKLQVYSEKYKSITSRTGQKIIARNKPLVVLPFEGTPSFALRTNKYNFKAFEEICYELGMFSLLSGKSLQTWKTILKAD